MGINYFYEGLLDAPFEESSLTSNQISTWWDETPTHDKIYGITKGTTSTITNIIIGDKCLHVPGASENIRKVLLSENIGNVKGSFFELESGLQFLERDEELISLDIKLGGRQFNAMTKTKLFEYKNYNWNNYIGNTKIMNDL